MRRLSLVLTLTLACVRTPAQLICSFESEDELKVVGPSGPTAERVREHATHGEYSLKCLFKGSEKDTWPGLSWRPADPDLSKYAVLAFDVHNPGREGVGLSWRIDDGHGKNVFNGASLPGRKTTTVELFLRGLESQLDVAKLVQVYPYIRMPRKDVLLYFDNFRFTTLDLQFTPLVYEETGPAYQPTPREIEAGYVLFARHWLDVVFPVSRPRPGETPPVLKAFAAPGEREPLTLSVYALRKLQDASVTVSDLACGGDSIPAANTAVYPVRCLNKRVTYSSKEYVADMPVLLENRGSVTVGAGESKRFWLDVRVPQDLLAGVYTGTVTFQSTGAPVARVPIALRILPFRLTEPRDAIVGEYYTGPKLAATDEEKRRTVERDLRDMREHGMTSVGLCMGVPVEPAELKDGEVSLNLDGASLYEHFMNLYRDLGFPAPIVQLSDSGQSFASKLDLRLASDEYARAYKAFWRAMQRECETRGWAEIIVQPVDEPGWQSAEHKDRNVSLLKLLKQVPGMRTEQDGPGDNYFHTQAGPFADVWNYNGGLSSPATIAEAKGSGHLVMIYNCDVESYRPEIGRYVAGFFQRRAGIHGAYNWSYMTWRGGPYDDLDHRTGTWMHVYPPYKGEPGGPSIGWQGYREGMDDHRYVATMLATAQRADANGNPEAKAAAGRARGRLQGLLDTITYSPRVRSTARWTGRRSEGGERFISGTLKIPNGWDFATYDTARWQLADATLAILEAMGEVPRRSPRPPPPARVGDLLTSIQWTSPEPAAGPAAPSAAYHVTIPQAAGGPEIDGDLSDAVWQTAAHVTDFRLAKDAAKPQQQTHAWLVVDTENLNIAFRCAEDNIEHITATVAQDGGPVWQDDCVEVFVDSNNDQATFRQIVVNSQGVQFWTDASDPGWKPASRAAARVGEDSWTVELAIPLADLGLAQSSFGLNLCRERRPMETLELTCWSPTGGQFGKPDRFGLATIGAPFFSNVRLGRGVLGQNTFSATVTNRTDKEGRFVLKLHWEQDAERPGTATAEPVRLRPGQSAEAGARYAVGTGTEAVRLRATLADSESGRELAAYHATQGTTPPLLLSVVPKAMFTQRTQCTMEAKLSVAGEVTASSLLRVTMVDGESGDRLGEAAVIPIFGSRLAASLHVGVAGAGQARVRAELVPKKDSATARPRATAEAMIVRVSGPFE